MVFDAGTATEVHAHYRANDFAVLITEKFASKTECRVNNSAQNSVKFVHNWQKSAKSGDFAIFKLYFAMSVNFPMKLSRITKFGEISDIAKPWAIFCCPGYYKKSQQTML